MKTCRYCNKTTNNIIQHINRHRFCEQLHSLWKRENLLSQKESELNRKERMINNFLNFNLSEIFNNRLIDEICIVIEPETNKINLLNTYSTSKIYELYINPSCPICFKENLSRNDFAVLNNCGHHICMQCLHDMESNNIHSCHICRENI